MSRYGRAVSAERTPVNPPARTRLVPLSEPSCGKTGRIVRYGGAVWIEGKHNGCTFTTEPSWIGPLKFWKAKRYAKRNGIALAYCNCGLNNGHRNPRECPVHGAGAAC